MSDLDQFQHQLEAGDGGDSSQLFHLLLMSAAMFLGAFGFGYFPLLFQFSTSRMRLINVAGAGLLIGAALIIIIPEGFHMWFEAMEHGAHGHDDDEHNDHSIHLEAATEEEHHHHNHWQLGCAMALGFALMLLIEQLGGSHGHSHKSTSDTLTDSSPPSMLAMLGLMIHAAIDGVALGGTAVGGGASASLIIFIAILLHKAPAAFGLSTYLLQHKYNPRHIKQQLLLFALAAPAGAILTYFAMTWGLLGYEMSTLALVMLFSAGTFLFVATAHILPEIMHLENGLSRTEVRQE